MQPERSKPATLTEDLLRLRELALKALEDDGKEWPEMDIRAAYEALDLMQRAMDGTLDEPPPPEASQGDDQPSPVPS